MSYTFTLKSGEVWESTHLPTNAPWQPYTGDATTCSRCGQPATPDQYEYIGTISPYCSRCYEPHRNDDAALPVSLSRPWFTVAAYKAGWRVANKAQTESFLGSLGARLWQIGGLYPELNEIFDLIAAANNPRLGSIIPDLMVNARGNPFPNEAGYYAAFMHRGQAFVTIMHCLACGRGGQIQDRGIGYFHTTCWVWFRYSGAIEAEGLVELGCGHYQRPAEPDAPVVHCLDCGARIVSSCNTCDRLDHNAPRCSLHQSFYRHRVTHHDNVGVKAAKIDAGFNMCAALADFYILTDLHERAPSLVKAEYVRRVQEIANEIARYTIMATGGEARHWSERAAQDSLCIVPIAEGEEVDPAQTYCRYCSRTKPVCENHAGYRSKVIHYHGLNMHYHCPDKFEASVVYTSSSTELTIDGVSQQLQSSRALWSPFALDPGRRGQNDRVVMWGSYTTAFRKHGLPVLDACVTMFETGAWAGAFGGQRWARAARLVRDFAQGSINPPVFIDSIFGVQHNGGSLFDKVYLLKAHGIELGSMLNVRRMMHTSAVLLPFASPATRWQWLLVATELQDPELLLGVELWRKAAEEGPVTPNSFARELRQYSQRTDANKGWFNEAQRFRVRQADLPAWRRRLRKARIKKAAAIAQLQVVAVGVTA